MILLEKSLLVLEEGILEGRNVFANILKYIRMGASSIVRQYVQRAGSQRFLAVFADGADPTADEQFALRFFAGADSRPTTSIRSRSPSRFLGRWTRSAASFCSSALAARFSTTSTFCVMFYVFGCWAGTRHRRASCASVSDRLVSGIADDTDAHHPRHPHEQDSLLAKPGELAVDGHSAVVMAVGIWLPFSPVAECAGFRADRGKILADRRRDPALLHRANAVRQDVALLTEWI